MNVFTVTAIQFFEHTQMVQISETDFEEKTEYWANVAINDKFMVQVHGNKEECTFDGVCHSDEACWNDDKNQDYAFDNYDINNIESQIESEGFENNYHWLKEHGESMH